MLERGAVEGEIFHRGAVQALAPDDEQVTPRLTALVRRGLIRPERAQLPGEDGFRFRHVLIRDAAYDALPKATRAELHERFAGWLEQRGAGLVELDEILGYHLEQSACYKHELGAIRPGARRARRESTSPQPAGRALWRSDEGAAARLLERALELNRPHRLDCRTSRSTWPRRSSSAAPERAAAIAEAAAERARAAGDETGEALARVAAARYRSAVAADPAFDELEALARATLSLLEEAEDHAGLVHVWLALGTGLRTYVAAARTARTRPSRRSSTLVLAGQHVSHLFGLAVCAHQRAAARGRGAAHDRRAPARESEPLRRC